MLAGQGEQFAHGGGGRDGDGVADDAALELLHGAHFPCLGFERHVLVDDADAAFLSEGDGETGLGDGVHRRRDEGDVERDVAGQAGLEVHFRRQHLGVGRQQQNVVVGQRFVGDPQHGHPGNGRRGTNPRDAIC